MSYFLFFIWAVALNLLECESFYHYFEYVETPPPNEEKEGRNPYFLIELNQDVKVVKEYEKNDREPEYFNGGEVNKLGVAEKPCYVEDQWGTRRESFYPYRIVNGDDLVECASSGEKKHEVTEEPFRKNFTWMTEEKGIFGTTEKSPEVLTTGYIKNRFGNKEEPVSEEIGSGSGSGDFGIIDDEDFHHVKNEIRKKEEKNKAYANRYGSEDFLFMD